MFKIDQWASVDRTEIEARELHERIIMRKGLFSEFYNEAFPFCQYLRATERLSSQVRCAIHCDSNVHYDATVKGETLMRFEITQALSDRYDLRMRKLLDEGTVNPIGRMTYSGTKATGHEVEIEDGFVPVEQGLFNIESMILRAFKRKTSESTKNQNYSHDTSLIISFSDFGLRSCDLEEIRRRLVLALGGLRIPFQSAIVIGLSGLFFAEFPRDGAAD